MLALGAAESVVGITDAFKPYPERRGLYRPNAARGVARCGDIFVDAAEGGRRGALKHDPEKRAAAFRKIALL